ncbi:MAG: 2Fe-2S iron-sulfur cluster-binding protein [Phycisphaerales bacterium]
MDWLTPQVMAFTLGGLLIVATVVRLGMSIVSGARRMSREERLAELELRVFQEKIDLARSQRAKTESAQEAWDGFRKFEVARKRFEGGDICSFYLKPHDGRPLPGFKPGQYLTFQLRIPGQSKPVIRCYSLSDAPCDSHYRVSIKRCPPPRDKPEAPPGLSSNFFHDQVNEGDILDVRAPSGGFYCEPDGDELMPVVLIGGGIGLTPVLSMAKAIADAGVKRETWLFYGVRNNAERVLGDELEAIGREHDHIHVRYVHSSPGEDEVEGRDYDLKGYIGVELFKQVLPSNNYIFHICGPPPMMASLVEQLEEWGVPDEHVRFEAFGPATVKRKKKAEDTPAGDGAPAKTYTVTFERSAVTEAWDSESDSLLDFGEDKGVALDSGCRAGNCGSCLVAIKSGSVAYDTEPGAKPESGSCLLCVCRPTSDLVLDA